MIKNKKGSFLNIFHYHWPFRNHIYGTNCSQIDGKFCSEGISFLLYRRFTRRKNAFPLSLSELQFYLSLDRLAWSKSGSKIFKVWHFLNPWWWMKIGILPSTHRFWSDFCCSCRHISSTFCIPSPAKRIISAFKICDTLDWLVHLLNDAKQLGNDAALTLVLKDFKNFLISPYTQICADLWWQNALMIRTIFLAVPS